MNRVLSTLLLVLLTTIAPLGTKAATFFSDTFSSGSTLNQLPVAPTPTSTSYQTAIGSSGGSSSLNSSDLSIVFPSSTSVLGEVLALFTNTPVTLSSAGDYVAVTVVFTNTDNILTNSTVLNANASLNIGLFYSGGVLPNQGHIVLNTGNSTNGTEDWIGYASRIFFSGNSTIFTRPAQTPNGTSSQNQDLLFTGASGSQAFNSPPGTSLGSTSGSTTLTEGAVYTLHFVVTFTGINSLTVSNALYEGVGTGGTRIFGQAKVATGGNFMTASYDGFAVGWRNSIISGQPAQTSAMDISSIEVTGVFSPPTPPTITSQPTSVVVATNGSCAFFLSAAGANLTYQWQRNGTNLVDGGNISGSSSDLLVISPAGVADVLSGANGYYCTVTSTGGSTNSTTNSLSLVPGKNLTWSGPGAVWDLNTSVNWQDPGSNPSAFTFGDTVTFNGNPPTGVTLTGRYLSASSVTVEGSTGYAFSGAGNFAGLGALIFTGTFLDMGNTNSYSGGTIISNSSAYLYLQSYSGLGTGPVTLAKAGGLMEIASAGSASVGINSDIIVADDFTIQFDGVGSFAGVLFGDLSGSPGKVLTFNPANLSTTNRYRVYGTNTVYNANLVLNGPATSQALYNGTTLAPYNSSGSQVYNGVISGNGGIVQRGNGGATILNGANTYAGGTTPTTGTIGFGTNTAGSVTSGPIGTGPLFLAPELPNVAGSATVFASGGARTIANPVQYPSATNNQTLIIGGTNDLTFSGPYTLNGNDGFGPVTNRTLQVNNTALTTLSGVISDNGLGFGLIKTGNGALALNNTETYKGPTRINGGVLQVNGQLGTNTVTVATNGTLAGTGTIPGAVTVQQGGTLTPGTSIGTLTINNDLTVAGNVGIEVNTSLGTTSDKAAVSGVLTNAGTGTIVVTNLGPALVTGDTFALFNKAMSNGAALTITGGGPVFWTNKLAIDGTISVLQTIPSTPTNISISLAGNTLTLSWPGSHLGWSLQSNSVSLTLTSNWFTVSNSSAATTFMTTRDATKTNVFFRMVYP
jgi:autotransporter-associated beta strand protein